MAPATEQLTDLTTDHLEPLSSAEKRLGTVVAGTYQLERHIGSGGSSHVFEAEHVRLGKRFAVKLLRPELDTNRRTAQRFRREARAIARLKSEHIVSVVDCGELDDGTPYLVMELLEGEDLRSLLSREGTLPARRAVALIIEACRGLSEVHAAGLVHRDLKPENLFITRRSTGEDWCKVLDFGVAKMEASLSTAQGAIIGTVRYMAPEQVSDGESVGPATDVYALGAVLYECLTGTPLVQGGAVHEVMYRLMNVPPKPLSEAAPSLPSAITDVVDGCVSKSPQARPADAKVLAALLGRSIAASSHSRATSETPDEEAPRSERRTVTGSGSRGGLILIGALATLGAGAAGWALRGSAVEPRVAGSSASPNVAAVPSPNPIAPSKAQAVEAKPQPVEPAPVSSSKPGSIQNAPRKERPVADQPVPAPPRAAGRFDATNPYGE